MIQKMTKAVITVVLIASLAGCNVNSATNQKGRSTITATKLTERESELLNNVGIQHKLVYDVNDADLEASWGHFWVDHYKNGQFKGKVADLSSSMPKEKNGVVYHAVLAIQEPDSNSDKQKWHLSFAGGRYTTVTDAQKGPVATEVKVVNEKKIEIGEDITIGIIAQGKNTAIIPEDIFEKEDSSLKELLKNEEAYILRCRFK